MMEPGWLTCTDPQRMLDFLRGRVSERKLRLFACACCRHFWSLLTDPRSRRVVELMEHAVDRQATEEELHLAVTDARAAWFPLRGGEGTAGTAEVAADLAWRAPRASAMVVAVGWAFNAAGGRGQPFKDPEYQCAILRDLFLPFHRVAGDPTWRTSTVIALAQAAYDDGAFDLLPVLGDALEEAGCTELAWLEHCRRPAPHVRGCWLLDLLLSKDR